MEKRIKFDKVQLLILLQLLLCVCIIIFTIMKKSNIVSLCFTSTFILLIFMLFILIIENKLSNLEMSNLLLLYLIIMISFAGVAFGSNTLSFSYYKKLIMFYSTIIFLFIVSKIRVNKKVIDLVIGINVVVGIIYIANYYLGVRSYYAGGLTFNFSNPNLTSMWLVQTCLYSILAILYYRKKLPKFLSFIVACFMIYFVNETRARTGLITIILFITILILTNIKKRIKLSRSIITLIVLSPFIAACIYMISIKTGFIENFSFLESEGKSLNSRYGVWTLAFNQFKLKPFMGNYFGISNGTGMSQMHNSHMDILASYGIIVFLLVMIYITRLTNYINSKVNNKFQIMSLIAFLSIIVMGFGEAALFSGGIGMYILTGMFLLLARYNEQS